MFIEEKWWRRRESNPGPKALTRKTLHACPFLKSHRVRRRRAENPHAASDGYILAFHAPSHSVSDQPADDVRPGPTGEDRKTLTVN